MLGVAVFDAFSSQLDDVEVQAVQPFYLGSALMRLMLAVFFSCLDAIRAWTGISSPFTWSNPGKSPVSVSRGRPRSWGLLSMPLCNLLQCDSAQADQCALPGHLRVPDRGREGLVQQAMGPGEGDRRDGLDPVLFMVDERDVGPRAEIEDAPLGQAALGDHGQGHERQVHEGILACPQG